jgi:hypothetical protein
MINNKHIRSSFLLSYALFTLVVFFNPLSAADFNIGAGATETNQQTLIDNETGYINSSGSLTTNNTAILANGVNNTVTNYGTIATTDNTAHGISSSGINLSFTNNGSITTLGDSADGIHTLADDAVIVNNGSIITNSNGASGLFSNGNNAHITNNGDISAFAFGIFSNAGNATVINNGTISSTNNSAFGLFSQGSDVTLTNSGVISTSGTNAYAIFSTSNNALINNSGLIETTGTSTAGIFIAGNNASIYQSNHILTHGDIGYGIYTVASDTTIDNSGSIQTTGNSGVAIYSLGNNLSLTHSGNISTQGDGAHAILSTADNANIIVTGSVKTTGNNAIAIYSLGNSATISSSGRIAALSSADTAILAGSNDVTLNLLTGFEVIGRIDLGDDGGDNDTVNIYLDDTFSTSKAITFENTENINLFGSAKLVGNTVFTIDRTAESTRGLALSTMTSSIHQIINRRLSQPKPLKPVQLASLDLLPGIFLKENKPVAWAQVFGGSLDRDADANLMAFEYDHAGLNLGYEWDISKTRVGIIGGYVKTNFDTHIASFSSEADNYYIGAYTNKKLGDISLTGSVLAGYGDHSNQRLVIDNINGTITTESDFDSIFLSPGLSIASAYRIDDRLELRPSASIAYSIAWLDSYTESGPTNANLHIDDRKAKALTANITLAAAYELTAQSELEFRLGLNSRHTNDDETKASIAGSSFKFASGGDQDVTSGFAGIRLRVAQENLSLVTDMEFGGNNNEDYVAAQLSMEYVF